MKFGIAFGETIGKKTRKTGNTGGLAEVFGEEGIVGRVETELEFLDSSISPWRVVLFSLALVVCLSLLFFKLVRLQVIEGERNLALSDGNRIMVRAVHAGRGVIYDRKGRVLVRNVPAFRYFKSSTCQKGEGKGWGEPKEFCSGYSLISREEALALEAKGGPEAERLEIDTLRQYIYPEIFSHVLGYTGELTSDEFNTERIKDKNYILGDRVGRTGIEEQYEDILRGKDGKELFEVDAFGSVLRELGKVDPQDGPSVTLNIDMDLQKAAYNALGDVKGMVIASDPTTGELLAMVSRPTFNPNAFTMSDSDLDVSKYIADSKNMPMLNRAISGTYPPGSTFKLVVAGGALEEGKITKSTQVLDNGVITIGPYTFPNWYYKQYGKTEGQVNVIMAIKRSNDIFFYKVAEIMGNDMLASWEKKFGLGEKIGVDLPGELTGLVPTDEWKRKAVGDKWYLGDTMHLGIGQGYLLTTPIQVNYWTSVVANDGRKVSLKVAKDVSGKFISPSSERVISKENANLIREGMIGACSEGGTGYPLFNFQVAGDKLKSKIDGQNFTDAENGKVGVAVACKTGTAEYGDPKGKTHAWFTMFAPAFEPTIAITVLVEGGGEGSTVAAPVAKKVLEEWFK